MQKEETPLKKGVSLNFFIVYLSILAKFGEKGSREAAFFVPLFIIRISTFSIQYRFYHVFIRGPGERKTSDDAVPVSHHDGCNELRYSSFLRIFIT